MDCSTLHDLNGCSSLSDIQGNATVTFMRKIFNQIPEHVDRLEISAILDSLNLLCGDSSFLEIIQDEKCENLVVKMLFASEAQRGIVQDAIMERSIEYRVSNFDGWHLISGVNLFGDSLYGLKFSDLQTALILGRDRSYLHYIQQILKNLKVLQNKNSLMKMPYEFLFPLCTFLSIKDLGRFSLTNKKAYALIHLDKSELIWLEVAKNYKMKVSLNENVSVKQKILDKQQDSEPWNEMPFGKIHQITFDIIVSKTYLCPSMLGESRFLYESILQVFNEHIPKDNYLEFECTMLGVKVYLIFYRDEFGETQHKLLSERMSSDHAEFIKELSKKFMRSTGRFE